MARLVTLRRYAPMKQSAGTTIPARLRLAVQARDQGCVGPKIGMPENCFGGLELDHVRAASFAAKSATEEGNLVSLCSIHHRIKTLNGREWRPKLLAWIAEADTEEGK